MSRAPLAIRGLGILSGEIGGIEVLFNDVCRSVDGPRDLGITKLFLLRSLEATRDTATSGPGEPSCGVRDRKEDLTLLSLSAPVSTSKDCQG